MKGFVNQAGLLSFAHDPQCFIPRNLSGKSLGGSVPGRFTKSETVQHGRMGLTFIAQKTPPLAAETISHGNIVKLLNNIRYGLTREYKVLGHIQILVNFNDL